MTARQDNGTAIGLHARDSPVIEVRGLRKVYANGFRAVSDVYLDVPQGIFGLLGPNGAGKTTLMGMLVGTLRPTLGTARILGLDILRDSKGVRRLIGYMPEHPPFYEGMTALRFLIYMGELAGMSYAMAQRRSEELLEWLGLKGWASAPIRTFSAGMRQRLGMAQALVGDPEVLFLDEPTSNLDPLGRADFIQRVKELAGQGKTIVVSTHVIPEMEQMVDHVAIMAQGRVAVAGEVAKLTDTGDRRLYRVSVPDILALQEALRDLPSISGMSRLDAQLVVETLSPRDLSSAVMSFCQSSGQQLLRLEPVRPSLQGLFERALKESHT